MLFYSNEGRAGIGKRGIVPPYPPNPVPHSPPVGGPYINNDDVKMIVLMLAYSLITLLILSFMLQEEA
jgi:hypothetical protein